jgi:small subunit ribosomal protein S13
MTEKQEEKKTEQKPEQKKEEKQKEVKKTKKTEKEEKKHKIKERHLEEDLVRILSTDIPANMKVYPGLTKIKGVSWSFSNALCYTLKIDKNKKMSELSEQELKKITDFIKNPDPSLPSWLLNRRKDITTGEDKHLSTTDLDLQKDFDIRALKKMRAYKGIRHMMGQPVRGQRTRAHFRQGKSIGVQRAKVSKKK